MAYLLEVIHIFCLPDFRYFDYFTLLVIVTNSFLVAAYDFSDRGEASLYNQNIHLAQLVCQFIYVAEMVLKIMAMGFFHRRNSYLRDGWNVIDFIVIILG